MAATEHPKTQPDEHDHPAAADCPSMGFTEPAAAVVGKAPHVAPIAHRKATDLLNLALWPAR